MTIERRPPTTRLKSVDFPTFGRPTSTTAGGSLDRGGINDTAPDQTWDITLTPVNYSIYDIYNVSSGSDVVADPAVWP